MPAPQVLPAPGIPVPPSPDGSVAYPPPERQSDGYLTARSAAALARPYTAEAVATLVGVMRDPASPVEQRRGAANDLLSRAWGKPKETVELLESDAQVATRAALAGLTGEDLRDLLRAVRGAPSPTEPVTIDVTPPRALSGGETTPPPPADADGGGDDAGER